MANTLTNTGAAERRLRPRDRLFCEPHLHQAWLARKVPKLGVGGTLPQALLQACLSETTRCLLAAKAAGSDSGEMVRQEIRDEAPSVLVSVSRHPLAVAVRLEDFHRWF